MHARREGRGAQDRDNHSDTYGAPRRPSIGRHGRSTSATLTVLQRAKKKIIDSSSSSSSSTSSSEDEDGLKSGESMMPAPSQLKRERQRVPNTQWRKMDGVVRKADKGKVKNCKEDIDTLLVFAGLFSAVLTAFVIESYHNLQPDTSTETVTLLRQISLQLTSFTINSGFANATHQVLTSISSAEPLGSAVLVNALWFASLIISLITASLAMLVKQWLHEYLAGDYYSPQARLRIRQFRHEGMQGWYVLEIAAVLPLLLQISLGLFFLGLCNFTFSVNSNVGWTTVPLIVAWLVVFLLMIVAPVFSPRCPYKVTFLVNAFKVLRKWIRRAVHLARQRSHHDSHNSDSDSVLSQPFGSTKFGWFEEEEDAVTSPKGDLRIFLAVDAMLADDNLIDGFYRGQIQQLRSRGPEVIDFVLDVMGRRMRDRVSRTRLPLQNLRPMSKVAWVGLTGILADVMEDSIVQDMVHPAHPDDDSPRERSLVDWMKDILKIVLSGSGYTFQPGEAKIIVHALLYDPENTVELLQLVGRPERDRQGRQRRRGRCISPHDFADILDLSFETFSSFDPDCVIRCMLELGRWTVSQYSDSLYDVIKSSRLGVKGVVAVARVLVDKLTEELEWRRECNVETWDNWFDDALPCIVHAFTRFGATPEDHDLGHEDPKRNDLRHDNPDISLKRDDPRRDIDKIAGVVWKLCAEDEATMAVVIRHLPEHESTTDGSNCPCLFAAAMGHRCISRDARERIMGNFKALVKDATCPEPANGLSPEKLCDVAKCMRNHQASYSEEKSQWRVFYSLLCPGDHARGDSGDTIVESQPDSLDELSHEQPLDSAYEEGPPGQPDPFMKRTMFQRPRYSSPTPLSPNMSLESGKTAVESGYTIVDPRRAKSMNSGEGWHAGYSPAIENGQSSPTERGFGEFKFIGPMQSTPVKQARKRRRLD